MAFIGASKRFRDTPKVKNLSSRVSPLGCGVRGAQSRISYPPSCGACTESAQQVMGL